MDIEVSIGNRHVDRLAEGRLAQIKDQVEVDCDVGIGAEAVTPDVDGDVHCIALRRMGCDFDAWL